MLLDAPSFVVQRRLNLPLSAVQRGLADRTPLGSSAEIPLDSGGFLLLGEPLRPVAPFSARQATPTWCGNATLLTSRRRVVSTIEVDVAMWSDVATSVTVRPVARHLDWWSGRRLRHYFALAHEAADMTTALLAQRAVDAFAATRDAEIDRFDLGVVPVGSGC